MVFGDSGVLAIELGSSHFRILHGAVSGHRLNVYDFASEQMFGADLESTTRQLEELIARKKLQVSGAALDLSGPGVLHRLLEFPLMPASELELVVTREMKTMGGTSEKDVVFDWEVIEETPSGNFKQIRVLVAMAPKSQVDRVQQILDRCHLDLTLLTTAPISLLRSLNFVQGEGSGFRGVLYLGGNQGYLLGVRNGVWNFYREFSSQASDQKGSLLIDEALKEVHRVLLYRRQHFPAEGEMSFLLGGDRDLSEIQSRLQAEMGVASEVVQVGPALDLTSLGGRAQVFRQLFPSFVIALGLVGTVYHERGINLAPTAVRKPVRRKPSISLSFVRRPAWICALLLIFVAIHLFLTQSEHRFQRILRERTDLYQQWRPSIEAAERSRRIRGDEELLLQSLGSFHISEPGWVALFKAVSRRTPSELVLQSVVLRREKEEWSITFKGQVISSDSYGAQSAFNRFYQGLKGLPQLERLELLPLSVSTFKERVTVAERKLLEAPSEEKAREAQTKETEIKKTKVEFEIRGHSKEL
jgi:Tfp pilus assembly PilM family ATPase